jgi:hypothetical protein
MLATLLLSALATSSAMPKLGPSAAEPHQLLTYPATTKLATNVDGDASPFAIDLDVDEPDALVVQEANPSVPNRSLLNTDDAGGPTATEWSFFGRPSGRSGGRSR